MKKQRLTFTIMSILISMNLIAQTVLERGMQENKIGVKLPSFLIATNNAERIYVTEINEKNPIPGINQQYGNEPSYGDTFFNVFFGTINSILTYKNGECVVFVHTGPRSGVDNYKKIAMDSVKLLTFKNISFERTKHDFKFGIPYSAPSEYEADELYSMLTLYPQEKAKKMFNANAMISYPLNLRGNVYKGKYTRGRAVVVGKDFWQFYLYFMMTDENVMHFEKFLDNFEKVFWFKH